ncbi:MAG TPA: tetratricopeptide repeat protein [Bacteroidales bacterium]|jgi:Flp pilus assembly protein TadD|nr:tetratricopeptide repeat protein [Bacteroidales bacterium]
MKKIRLNYLTFFALAAFLISGCAGLSKMKEDSGTVSYEVKPNPLVMKAGQVSVTGEVSFPEKYFNKNAVVVATPVLKYDGGQTEFPTVTMQGEKVEANNKVIPYAGGSAQFSGTVPYKPEMMKSELVVNYSARIKEKDPVEYGSEKVADGVVATEALVRVDPQTLALNDNFKRIIPETYTADIHYVINQADVRRNELKSDDIKTFEQKLADTQADSSRQIKGAKISAYASPDGPVDLNEKLSEKRETSAEKYFKKALKDKKITQAEAEGFLSKLTTPEDWEGFKTVLEKSDIQDKELILRVLSMYADPVVREKEIKNISAAYEELADEVLPQLRRSVMTIDVDVVGKSDDQLRDLAMSDPKSLAKEEILYSATLFNELDQKARIYKAATEQFPDCVRAKNNLGHVYLQQGKVEEAKKEFEAAKAINANMAVVNANLGAVALKQGDLQTAEQLLTASMSAGDAPSYNLGIIKIKQGDYAAAVNYFGNKPSFNAALAQMLNGNNDRAIATLNQLGDVKDAWVYYLKAVANARGGVTDAVATNLRQAIQLDPKVKEYAAKDAELLKVAENDAVKSLL